MEEKTKKSKRIKVFTERSQVVVVAWCGTASELGAWLNLNWAELQSGCVLYGQETMWRLPIDLHNAAVVRSAIRRAIAHKVPYAF